MPPIGVGLLGYGLAGAVLHAPLIEALPDYRIVAIATSRDEAGGRRDAPQVVPDVNRLLEIDAVELVIVVTPNDCHAEHAAKALAAGRHVVIDKPMAAEVAACDALIDQAGAAGVLLSVYHNRRWDGDHRAARALLASGEVGAVRLYHAFWDRFRPSAPAVWRNTDRAGAGLLWDLGPHMIDQALELFGWPVAIEADLMRQRNGSIADDYFNLRLHYDNARAVIGASSLIAATRPRMGLHGTGGSWWTEGLDPLEAALRAGRHPLEEGFEAGLRAIPAYVARHDGERQAAPVPAGDHLGFYRALARAIRYGEAPPVDPCEARDVVALIAAAHAGGDVPRPRARRFLPDSAGQG